MSIIKIIIFIFVMLATIAFMQIGKFLFIDCPEWYYKLAGVGLYAMILLMWHLTISKIGNIPHVKN